MGKSARAECDFEGIGWFGEVAGGIEKKEQGSTLSQSEAKRLSDEAHAIRNTFVAETRGVFIYAVGEKRLDVRKLLGKVEDLFAPGAYNKCPEIARFDFTEAGMCIAFERATAGAFHILRGTESVLQLYYKRHVRPVQQGLTWGQVSHALRQKSRGKLPDPIILNQLDHIRTAFRNPTQHPEKVYDIQEVQDLFGLCIDVVNRMIVVVG